MKNSDSLLLDYKSTLLSDKKKLRDKKKTVLLSFKSTDAMPQAKINKKFSIRNNNPSAADSVQDMDSLAKLSQKKTLDKTNPSNIYSNSFYNDDQNSLQRFIDIKVANRSRLGTGYMSKRLNTSSVPKRTRNTCYPSNTSSIHNHTRYSKMFKTINSSIKETHTSGSSLQSAQDQNQNKTASWSNYN